MAIRGISPEIEPETRVSSDAAARAKSWPTWAAVTIFLVLIVLLHPLYQYRINPDATSYDSLAKKWAAGDWRAAIAGHWAPLFIWLLAITKKFGLGLFAGVTLVDAVAAIALLAGLDRLCKVLDMNDARRFFALSLAAVWAVAFTFDEVTPDLLLCAALTWYLSLAIQGNFLRNMRQASGLGLIIGLAYLTKPYAIYFIALHLAVVFVARLRLQRIQPAIWMRSFAILAAVALLFAGSWVGAMSFKYHRFTTGSAGSMGFRIISPRWPSIYLNNVGLIEPPNDTAVSYWEDPEVEKLGLPSWSPMESVSSFLYYLRLIGKNISGLVLWFVITSIAAIPLFAGVIRKWYRAGRPMQLGLIVLAIITYPAGFVLLFISNRYLWPLTIWLIVLAAYRVSLQRRWLPGAVLLWISFLPYPLWCLSADRGQGAIEHQIGAAMIQHKLKGRSASVDEWHRSLYVSYYASLQYCGTTAQRTGRDVRKELRQIGIQYLIVWPGPNQDIGHALGLAEIEDPAFGKVKIYAVN